jgi:hypothetical protein
MVPTNNSPYPNPAKIFLRLCNLSSFSIEQINRYETSLWRKVAQTLFTLGACKKRLPSLACGSFEQTINLVCLYQWRIYRLTKPQAEGCSRYLQPAMAPDILWPLAVIVYDGN